jgi:hypothetical protein
MATRERADLETRCVESLLVLHVCVSLLCLVDVKRQFLYSEGAINSLAPP